ncbi:MAG: hypothetical protein AAF927_01535 [Bacteroidota bacterium]
MAESSPYIDQIDAYLRKQLSPEEHFAFEQALDADLELKDALKKHLEALIAIRQKGFQEEVKKGVAEFEGEKETKIRRLSPLRLMAMAAAILLLAVVVWWLLPAAQNDSQALFASHFYAPNASDLRRGGPQSPADSLPTPLIQGLQAYQQQLYPAAIADFRAVDGDRLTASERSWLSLLTGVSYLVSANTDSAQFFLSRADMHSEMGDWYLALTALKGEQLEKARRQLEEIAQDDNHDYQLLAQALLADWGNE